MLHQGHKDLTEQREIENARVGYQVATTLWVYEAEMLWSKFNALLVANSIVLGSIVLTMKESGRLAAFSLGMPIAGIVLCIFWLLLMIRSFKYHVYLIFSAREIEEQFLSNSVKTVSRGGDFAEGRQVDLQIGSKSKPLQMSHLARLRVRCTSYSIIGIFLLMYVWILVSSWESSP